MRSPIALVAGVSIRPSIAGSWTTRADLSPLAPFRAGRLRVAFPLPALVSLDVAPIAVSSRDELGMHGRDLAGSYVLRSGRASDRLVERHCDQVHLQQSSPFRAGLEVTGHELLQPFPAELSAGSFGFLRFICAEMGGVRSPHRELQVQTVMNVTARLRIAGFELRKRGDPGQELQPRRRVVPGVGRLEGRCCPRMESW